MQRDMTISEVLFQSLLDHFWKAKDNGYPREFDQAPKGFLISYSKLVDISKVPLNPRNAGGPLYDIAVYCREHGLPSIHSLVVAKDTGIPGEGFFRVPGSDYEGLIFEDALRMWQTDVEKCMDCSRFDRKAPPLP